MVAYLPSGRLLDGGGMVGVFEPQGPFPPGPTSSFCLAASAGDFLPHREPGSAHHMRPASGGPVVGSPRVDDAHPRA